MTDQTCACGHPETEEIRRAAERAPCAGKPRGCHRPITNFVVYLGEPGQGIHVLAPLELDASCRRHLARVRRLAQKWAVRWLGIAVINPSDVPAVLSWFHSPAGFCAGGRGLCVGTPGEAVS